MYTFWWQELDSVERHRYDTMGQAQQEQYRIAKHAYWLEQQQASSDERLSSDAHTSQTGTMDEYEIRDYIVRLRSEGVIQDAVRVKRPPASISSDSHPKRQRLAGEEDERAVMMTMTMMTMTNHRQQYPKAAEEGERGGGGGADMFCFGAARDNSFSSESSLPVGEVSESTVTGINSSSSSSSDLGSLLEPDGIDWTGNNSQP
jgi:hypothetical protein